jgi:hypothetical protein
LGIGTFKVINAQIFPLGVSRVFGDSVSTTCHK